MMETARNMMETCLKQASHDPQPQDSSIVRTGVSFSVSPDDQQQLEAIVADRNARQKHVWRARIILERWDARRRRFP